MASPLEVHTDGLAKIRESEEFSDCKIICGPYHFNVHKVILATQSEYFKAALKRGTFKEGQSGVIEVKAVQDDSEDPDDSCDDPETVKLMIEYFYHFNYLKDAEAPREADWLDTIASKKKKPAKKSAQTPGPTLAQAATSIGPNSHLVEHAKVFAIAVKYQVDRLRGLAAAKFTEAMKVQWNHPDFGQTISIVYNSTPEDVTELRNLVADQIHESFDVLKDKGEVEEAVRGIPGLAYSLLKRSRDKGGVNKENVKCRFGHSSGSCLITCHHCCHGFDHCAQCCRDNMYVTCKLCNQGRNFGFGFSFVD